MRMTTRSRNTHRACAWQAALLALGLAAALALGLGCGTGTEALLLPTRMHLSPSLVVAAPGEIVDYGIRLYSVVGVEIPTTNQLAVWSLASEPLPPGIIPPDGQRDYEQPGVIDDRGQFEASPVVQHGHYRVGTVSASVMANLWGRLTNYASVIVDGSIDENAPSAELFPQDLRVPAGTSVQFITLSIEPESKRVALDQHPTWSVLSGLGTIDATTGIYAAPAGPFADAAPEVQIGARMASGRRAAAYVTLTADAAGVADGIHLVPDRTLKVGLGRSQRFLAYGTDGDGRFVALSSPDWFLDGAVGTLTPGPNGTAEFLATAPGDGVIRVVDGRLEARQAVVSVVAGT